MTGTGNTDVPPPHTPAPSARALPAFGAGLALLLAAGLDAGPAAAGAPIDIAPHRAVYDISFDRARGAGGLSDISGRLVFELRGSACEGYTVNRRFVSHLTGEEVVTTSDQQLTTFEEADGSSYRFISRSYFDGDLSEQVDGLAIRRNGDVTVELTMPHEEEIRLAGEVVFPFQHLRRLMEAANDGKSIVLARVFEGSDAGQAVYDTTAIIGRAKGDDSALDAPGAEALDGLESWHVAIAYFENRAGAAEVPKYEFSYDLYANGVSTGIVLDYGDYVLRGELSSLELAEPSTCD